MPVENTPGPPVNAAALCLGAVLILVDIQLLAGWRWGGVLAAPFIIGYFALCWGRIMLSAKLLLGVCALLTLPVLLRPGGIDTLVTAFGRMTFLPAFVAALGLLRAAAGASDTVAAAGRLLVNQKPSRRYAALTLGGHIFGVLLNIGGLALLLDMTKRANTLEAGHGDPRVVEIRERRMTTAVMRGFAAIAFWSPLGVAVNLLLASMPDVAWLDVAPYGFAAALAFMALGFLFDRIENPQRLLVPEPEKSEGGGKAVAGMIGHIVAISGLSMAAEALTHLSFQTILVNLVPLYAAGWLVAGALRAGLPPLATAFRSLRDEGVARWPGYANEISIFAASGLSGVVLADLAPTDALQAMVSTAALPAGVFAAGLALTVIATGALGVNPMISASILAATFSTITVPGLSHANVVLALSGGWVCIIGFAPLMSSLVMTAAVIGRRATEVGVRWNGRFTLAAVILWLLALLVIRI